MYSKEIKKYEKETTDKKLRDYLEQESLMEIICLLPDKLIDELRKELIDEIIVEEYLK